MDPWHFTASCTPEVTPQSSRLPPRLWALPTGDEAMGTLPTPQVPRRLCAEWRLAPEDLDVGHFRAVAWEPRLLLLLLLPLQPPLLSSVSWNTAPTGDGGSLCSCPPSSHSASFLCPYAYGLGGGGGAWKALSQSSSPSEEEEEPATGADAEEE